MRKTNLWVTTLVAAVVFGLMFGYVRYMVEPPGRDVMSREVALTPSDGDPSPVALRRLVTPGRDDVLVDYNLTHVSLAPGGLVEEHRVDAPQVLYFLDGNGVMTVAGESMAVEPGQAVYVPARAAQTLRNTGGADLCFLAIDDPGADSPFTAQGLAEARPAQEAGAPASN